MDNISNMVFHYIYITLFNNYIYQTEMNIVLDNNVSSYVVLNYLMRDH